MSDLDTIAKLQVATEEKAEVILTFLNKKTNRQETIHCQLVDMCVNHGVPIRLQIEKKDGKIKYPAVTLYFLSELGEIKSIKEATSKQVLYPT